MTPTRWRRWLAVLVAPLAFFACGPGETGAEVKVAKATIQDSDDQDRTISVTIDEGAEVLLLDVIRKTQMTIGDKEARQFDLQSGQRATITYDPELSVVTRIDAAPCEIPQGQINLFNGNDLDGWRFVIPPKYAQPLREHECWDVNVERKLIAARGIGTTWLATESTFDNFTLTFEWRFPVDGILSSNGSGVVIRAGGIFSNDADPRGIEIDISESKTGDFICYGTPLANSKRKIAGETQQRLERLAVAELRPIGKWNRTEIFCDQDRITVTMNGKLVNEATGARVKKGEICFRSQNTAIEFRKIRLTPIGDTR